MLRPKFTNLINFTANLLSLRKDNRPACDTMLQDKHLWSISIDELANDFKLIEIRQRTKTTIKDNFIVYFIHKKLGDSA